MLATAGGMKIPCTYALFKPTRILIAKAIGRELCKTYSTNSDPLCVPEPLHAEVGGACVLQLPPNHTVSSATEVASGKALQVTPVAGKPGRFSFVTAASTDVAVHIGAGAPQPQPQPSSPSVLSALNKGALA